MIRHCLAILFAALLMLPGGLFAAGADERDEIGVPQSILERARPPRDNGALSGKCRGKYLRDEERVVASEKTIKTAIVIEGPLRQPALRLVQMERQTVEITKVYEMRYRIFIPNQGQPGGSYSFNTIPGEVWRDKPKQVVRTREVEPLAMHEVSFNGRRALTDSDGIIRCLDAPLDILADFDNLSVRKVNYTIAARGFHPDNFTVYRTMPQRRDNDEKRLEEPPEQDLLVNYRLDFLYSKGQPEQEALECSYELPSAAAVVRTGERIPLTVRVVNRGKRPTSCLLARTFCRLPGINGKLFYFGAVAPGAEAKFTRYIIADSNDLAGMAFVEIRFSDSWGIPKQKLEFQLPLIH